MEQIKKKLNSKNGEAYFYLCVIVVFICMLISVVILYMGLMAQVRIQKKDVRSKLDSLLASYATEEYDSLKQGSEKEEYLAWSILESEAYVALGFPEDSDAVYVYQNGSRMTRPTVTILKGNGFGVTVEYTAFFPIQWNGVVYSELEIPVTVTSYYKMK